MGEERPFRFGVIGERVTTPDGLRATARAAEAAGFATFLLRDHLIAEPFGDQLAPLPALATVAAATSTLRLGTLVLGNDYRHPAVLAKEAATLDRLSGGRFELGIGAGWLREEYDRAGIPFDGAGVRIDRLAESLTVLKRLLGGDAAVSFRGRHYRLDELEHFPPPTQRPRLPILIGGGACRMLTLAGNEADIVNVMNSSVASGVVVADPTMYTPEAVDEKLGWIREGAGARWPAVELSLVVNIVVTGEREDAATTFARERGWDGVEAAAVLAMPSVLIGTVEEIAAEARARRTRFGFSYLVVGDDCLDEVAPIISRLAGT